MFDSAHNARRSLRLSLRQNHGSAAVVVGYTPECQNGHHVGICKAGQLVGCTDDHTSCLCWCHDVRHVPDSVATAFLAASADLLSGKGALALPANADVNAKAAVVDRGQSVADRVAAVEAKPLSAEGQARVDSVVALQGRSPTQRLRRLNSSTAAGLGVPAGTIVSIPAAQDLPARTVLANKRRTIVR